MATFGITVMYVCMYAYAHLAALCRTPLRYVSTYVCMKYVCMYVCTLGSVRGTGWTYGVMGSGWACFDIAVHFLFLVCAIKSRLNKQNKNSRGVQDPLHGAVQTGMEVSNMRH